jgi:hypothetical protein
VSRSEAVVVVVFRGGMGWAQPLCTPSCPAGLPRKEGAFSGKQDVPAQLHTPFLTWNLALVTPCSLASSVPRCTCLGDSVIPAARPARITAVGSAQHGAGQGRACTERGGGTLGAGGSAGCVWAQLGRWGLQVLLLRAGTAAGCSTGHTAGCWA